MSLESATLRLFRELFSGGRQRDERKENPSVPYGWNSEMVPRKVGKGQRMEHSGGGGFSVSGSVRIQWVSRETDAEGKPLKERRPSPCEVKRLDKAFRAAGKVYPDVSMLAVQEDEREPWALDMYGRTVLALRERFPCFDSSDYIHENRYFRWFYLFEGGKLTCVYHTDGSGTVTVTEDVLDIENQCWEEIQALDSFHEKGQGQEKTTCAPVRCM